MESSNEQFKQMLIKSLCVVTKVIGSVFGAALLLVGAIPVFYGLDFGGDTNASGFSTGLMFLLSGLIYLLPNRVLLNIPYIFLLLSIFISGWFAYGVIQLFLDPLSVGPDKYIWATIFALSLFPLISFLLARSGEFRGHNEPPPV